MYLPEFFPSASKKIKIQKNKYQAFLTIAVRGSFGLTFWLICAFSRFFVDKCGKSGVCIQVYERRRKHCRL